MKFNITSTVREIPIESCAKRREVYLDAFFSDEERDAATGKPVQSVAGICAVKRALATLCRSLNAAGAFRVKEFAIEHTPDGAPVLGRFPDFLIENRAYTKEMFSISISHTRTTAYGLAAVQECIDGR